MRITSDSSVHDACFTAFDFETTGTNPEIDQIVEIGAVRFTTTGVLSSYSTLVKPTIAIPEGAARVHGITDADVASAPALEDTVPKLMEILDGAVLVAHNIRFDFQFLNNALTRIGQDALRNVPLVDTMQVSRKAVKSPSYALQAIAKLFEIPVSAAHRALEDADTCRKVLLRCIENLSVLGDLSMEAVLL